MYVSCYRVTARTGHTRQEISRAVSKAPRRSRARVCMHARGRSRTAVQRDQSTLAHVALAAEMILRRAAARRPNCGLRRLLSASAPPPMLRQRIPGHGWLTISSSSPGVARSREDNDALSWRSFAWRGVLMGFFPRGYPHSVVGQYVPYVGWTSVGLLAGRMQAVLATQAALFAAGLSAGAIPMAVAVQWVLKDGVGHAGAIVYAASVNTRFDADAKRYRFHSTCALTVADMIAVTMPFAPQHFFLLASLSSTTSSIANLAQVAARARIMSSFAAGNNLADCVRAGQTQGKLMSLVGTGAGAGLSWVIGPEPLHVMAVMMPLAAISLYAMHESSRVVVLRTLNVQRAERVYADIIRDIEARSDARQPALVAPSPEAVAEAETFVWPYDSIINGDLWMQPLFGPARTAAAPLKAWLGMARGKASTGLCDALPALEAAANSPVGVVDAAASGSSSWQASWCDGYAIAASMEAGGDAGAADVGARVALWHTADATALSKIRGTWHATLLRTRLSNMDASRLREAMDAASASAHAAWPEVHAALDAAGWDLESAHLDGDGGLLSLGHGLGHDGELDGEAERKAS